MSVTVGIEQSATWNVNVLAGLEQSAEWNVNTPSAGNPLSPCYDDGRCGPFQRINVDFMVEGESRVTWYLRETFNAPTPYTFQLQVGETANPFADDWQNVGPAVVNTFMMSDSGRRALGKQLVTHYRVVMTDSNAQIYYSQPAIVLGRLDMRNWLVVREITRQALLSMKQGPGGIKGFLLKKKRTGTKCTKCLDPYTGSVLNSHCPVCAGTRFISGYYKALPCSYSDQTNIKLDEQRSSGPEGWSMPTGVRGRFLGSPFLSTGDLWVDGSSDLRYYVEKVEVENSVNNVPVTIMVDMNQLPFNNIAYTIPLE